MNTWLARHQDAILLALRRLAAAPLNSFLSVLAIGVALALPAGGQMLLANALCGAETISGSGRPLLPMATPVTRPQAAMPIATPAISRAPRTNSGCCQTRGNGVEVTMHCRPRPGRSPGLAPGTAAHRLLTLPLPATELLTAGLPT